MKTFLAASLLFFIFFSCADKKDGEITDAETFVQDNGEKEVYYLEDAILLEQLTEFPEGEAVENFEPEILEEQIEETPNEFLDQSVSDEPQAEESVVVKLCKESFGICPDKFSCIEDGGSFSCLFAAECSKSALVNIDDLVKSPEKYSGAYVKIGWIVSADTPSCTKIECGKDNTCCNTCYSKLMLNISNFKIYLHGNGMNIGCVGNECDFAQKCFPALSEDIYLLWGRFIYNQGIAELLVDNFCQPSF